MHTLIRIVTGFAVIVAGSFGAQTSITTVESAPAQIVYISPRPGAELVRPETTIAIRTTEVLAADSVRDDLFVTSGSRTGSHSGRVVLADDHKTLVFRPSRPFGLDETVQITLQDGLRLMNGASVPKTTFQFSTITQLVVPDIEDRTRAYSLSPQMLAEAPELDQAAAHSEGRQSLTLPEDLPPMTATITNSTTSGGYYFLAPFNYLTNQAGYLTIVDGSGELVYYQPMVTSAFDFKRQPNGNLTYFSLDENRFVEIDNTYAVVDYHEAGNGYPTDLHELQILPNGHVLLMIYDDQIVDLSQFEPGGLVSATVTGLVVQEIDTSKNVVFEWRSWDHFAITDTYVSLTAPIVDYVHGNAIELDTDGDLMISSRHLNEITKIDRDTGAVIWRFGGKNNQFTLANESDPPFTFQHDIRRLANGNITLFDNRTDIDPPYSRAVEYSLDETNLIAERIWEYRDDTYGWAMGNAQRLTDGNTVINWGTASLMNEVDPFGIRTFQLEMSPTYMNYRGFRFPWVGQPTEPPTLVVKNEGTRRTLAFSWNGATDVVAYNIYHRNTLPIWELINTVTKSGFETHYTLDNSPVGCVEYQVVPIHSSGPELTSSGAVSNCLYVSRLTFLARP